jgi:hypothetical protein
MEYGLCSTAGNVKHVAAKCIENVLTFVFSLDEEEHKANQSAQGKDGNHFTATGDGPAGTRQLALSVRLFGV